MKYDEFAFLNQQLAAMLRDGVPIEGALRQLSGQMRRGALRNELELLEADLAKGRPLNEALAARQLPAFYTHLVQVGVRSNDLPGVLTLLADYYQRLNLAWTRLKGLMVYPVLVLLSALFFCYFISLAVVPKIDETWQGLGVGTPKFALVSIWAPPIVITILFVVTLATLTLPPIRRIARWRLPAFKESSLAQAASGMALMLKSGVPLGDALALAAQLEQGTPAGRDLAQWHQRLASGVTKFSDMAAGSRCFPPLFVWMVAHGGEDLPTGFQRAADIYQTRAAYRTDLLIYNALPCSVLVLGAMVLSQVYPMMMMLVRSMNMIGDFQ